MPVIRRIMPVVTVHRETLLNTDLSPLSRLLYAVLLASLDNELSLQEIAGIMRLDDPGELDQYLDELASFGAVDRTGHGTGPALTVHELPQIPAQRVHTCTPCQDCGSCACFYDHATCQDCGHLRGVRASAEQDTARWKQQLDAGATYTLGAHGNRLHRWDCHTLNSPEKGWQLIHNWDPKDLEHGYAPHWPLLPQLLTASEVRTRKQRPSCQLCKPDLPGENALGAPVSTESGT